MIGFKVNITDQINWVTHIELQNCLNFKNTDISVTF